MGTMHLLRPGIRLMADSHAYLWRSCSGAFLTRTVPVLRGRQRCDHDAPPLWETEDTNTDPSWLATMAVVRAQPREVQRRAR